LRLCDNCNRRHWKAKIDPKTGLQVVHKNGRRVFLCIACGSAQEEETAQLPLSERLKANILYIDLEISKSLYYSYGAKVHSKYLRAEDRVHGYYVICWSASYLGSDKVFSECIDSKSAMHQDDSKILKKLRDLMYSTDIIAGHNVDAYDIKRANTRFLLNGIAPVIDKKTVDTLRVARSKFAFESNRLGEICKELGLRDKDDITDADWQKIVRTGDKKTLKKVSDYCVGDVTNGKALLEKLLPYSGKKSDYGTTKGKPASIEEMLQDLKDEIRELKQ
jgi:hypothetical protein